MTLRLHKITLNNFRSYKGSHQLEFPTKSGLFFFTGINKAQAMGANGAGKSTFLDAIVWCLYGQTSRGLRAGDVITWEIESGCSVEVDLTVGDVTCKVRRTQKPNGLFLDDKIVDQPELEKTLRLNCKSFLYAVLNSQFGESFFNLQPTAKLTLLSDIMNLDFWLTKSEEAKKEALKLSAETNKLTCLVEFQERQITNLKNDIKELEKLKNTFKAIKVDKISKLKKEIKEVNCKTVELEIEEQDLSGDLFKDEMSLGTLCDAEMVAEGVMDKHLIAIQKCREKQKECQFLVKQYKEGIVKLKKSGPECPLCHQKITKEHMQKEIEEFECDISAEEDEILGYGNDIKGITENMIIDRSKLEVLTSKRIEKEHEISKVKSRIEKLKAELSSYTRDKNRLQENLADIENKVDPYSSILVKKNDELLNLGYDHDDNKIELLELGQKHVAVEYWIKGFKRIRLFVTEQAFRTLEVEVNNSLAQLGMADWQITFDIERENKSGGVTKGFVTMIKGPANKEPVRWESWSGGETQRLQLAGDLGLANLIMQQAGLINTIEFYDEPSTHLSPEGMLDLADMLHDRAINEDKIIWIVDHTTITNFGDFEGVIEARKTNDGSTISYRK